MENENTEDDVEITNEGTSDIDIEDTEIVDIEEKSADKIKKIKKQLADCEEEKKQILDDAQRAKADFLNARKRLEEERLKDKIRHQKQHVLELLPLCDSFQMAMSNKESWEKADASWRSGIEGIQAQLMQILDSYQVTVIDPTGAEFDPHTHEAVGNEEVTDENMVNKVVTVVQRGYEIKTNQGTEIIRPARVTIGQIKN